MTLRFVFATLNVRRPEMAKFGNVKIKGASGSSYEFTAYPGNTLFKAIGAVYVVTERTPKQDGGGLHRFLYVGETGDLSTRFGSHHKQGCFDARGANCICVFPKRDEDGRLKIENDILNNGDIWPCND